MDRWDVVNYLRALQGLGGRTVPTGPLAAPGVTGDKLPGFTRTAPTRPAPFMDSRNRVAGTRGSVAGIRIAAPVPDSTMVRDTATSAGSTPPPANAAATTDTSRARR